VYAGEILNRILQVGIERRGDFGLQLVTNAHITPSPAVPATD
jgi:hypothetical protein